jgi:hypothetical protein
MTENAGMVARLSTRVPHHPRHLGFLELHETAGWRLKVYGIAPEASAPAPEVVDTVKALAPTVLPDPPVHSGSDDPFDTDRYGVGFAIAHDSGDHVYALYDWWADGNELHQRVLSARRAWLGEMRPHPTEAIGSVSELAITEFERRAWLRHMLTNPDGPDITAYLDDRLEAEDV